MNEANGVSSNGAVSGIALESEGVSVDGIWRRYDNGFVAVEDLNLEILNGEFLVMVGPSGRGKSPTLRMIAGLEEISDGTMSMRASHQ